MKHLTTALVALAASIFMWAGHANAQNCSTYPFTLTNGQTADATQVMANFNTIRTCANSNLAHNGSNSDITALNGLTTPISPSQGGTGVTSLTGAIVNSYLATMADQTIKGNVSGGTASPTDLTATQVETMIQGKLPFEFYVFVGGLTGNGWILAAYTPSTNVVLATGKSACVAGTAATGSTTYTIYDNGSPIGTAVFTSGGCTATVTSSPYTLTAGHVLSMGGPVTGDATLANIGMTFGGTRN